jgi:hypothetical protein
MRLAESFRPAQRKSKLLLWLRRGFDIMVVGVMVLALIETISYLTDLGRGLTG